MYRQTLLTVASRALLVLFSYAATVIISRFLGSEGQGWYTLAITFATLATQFGNLGLHSSNTYFLARDKTRLDALLANSLWVSIVVGGGGTVAAVLVCQSAGWYAAPQLAYLWFGALMVPPRLFFILGSNLLVAQRRISLFNAIQVAAYGLLLVAAVVMRLLHGSVSGFLGATLLAWAFGAGLLLAVLVRQPSRLLAFDTAELRAGWRYSAKAYFVCLLGYLVMRGNIFVVQSLQGAEVVGQYSIAAQVNDALGLLPSSLAVVLFPRLVQDERRRWQATVRSVAEIGVVMLVACLLCAVLAEPFIRLSFTAAFLPAVPILLWMLPGTFFFALIQIVSQYLAAVGFPALQVGIWAAGFLLTCGLSVALVPRYGGVGAAVSLSIAYTVIFLLQAGLAVYLQRWTAGAAGGPPA